MGNHDVSFKTQICWTRLEVIVIDTIRVSREEVPSFDVVNCLLK